MGRAVSLRHFVQHLPLEVRPLGRISGSLFTVETAAFLPHDGPCTLVLWHPGPDGPHFSHVEGELAREGRAWRFSGPAAEGWVVHWIAEGPRRKP